MIIADSKWKCSYLNTTLPRRDSRQFLPLWKSWRGLAAQITEPCSLPSQRFAKLTSFLYLCDKNLVIILIIIKPCYTCHFSLLISRLNSSSTLSHSSVPPPIPTWKLYNQCCCECVWSLWESVCNWMYTLYTHCLVPDITPWGRSSTAWLTTTLLSSSSPAQQQQCCCATTSPCSEPVLCNLN